MPAAPHETPTLAVPPVQPAGEHLLHVNLGPQHPAMHGTLRQRVALDGENIYRCDPDIGFLHTGFEKLGEHLSYNQFVTVTDRMNYLSPICNNVAYALAVERLHELEVPERATLLRVIFCELTRIADHIVSVGLQAMDLGAFSVFLWAWEQRELLYDYFEALTGARLTTSWTRLGGVALDLPDGMEQTLRAWCAQFPQTLAETEKMLSKNRIFLDRTRGLGVLPRATLMDYGVTGPVARAGGVEYDCRVHAPYMGYEGYDFAPAYRREGDVFARYKVRLHEMAESVKIVVQALDRLRPGPVLTDDYKVALPPKGRVYTSMEELIHHFKLLMPGHGEAPPVGEAYVATEAPNGELGFYVVSDGTGRPYRVRVRPPSLLNYQSFPEMIRGALIADLVAVLSSLNVIAGELDR